MFSPYEGFLRVSFLIRWPGKIPAGQASTEKDPVAPDAYTVVWSWPNQWAQARAPPLIAVALQEPHQFYFCGLTFFRYKMRISFDVT